MKNRLDRTFRHAGFAIDAFIRMDVKHLLGFIKTLDRTHNDAIRVLARETWLANNVSHDFSLPTSVKHEFGFVCSILKMLDRFTQHGNFGHHFDPDVQVQSGKIL